jgi:hypothetical protein
MTLGEDSCNIANVSTNNQGDEWHFFLYNTHNQFNDNKST